MTLDIITLVLSGAAALLALLCLLTRQKQAVTGQDIARLRDEIGGELRLELAGGNLVHRSS